MIQRIKQLVESHFAGFQPQLPLKKHLDQLDYLIASMLRFDPADRPDIITVLARMQSINL